MGFFVQFAILFDILQFDTASVDAANEQLNRKIGFIWFYDNLHGEVSIKYTISF